MADKAQEVQWVWDESQQQHRYWRSDIGAWQFYDGRVVTLLLEHTPPAIPHRSEYGADPLGNNVIDDFTKLELNEPSKAMQAMQGPDDGPFQTHPVEGFEELDYDYEELHEGYKRRALDFFRVGKVIKCLWPENMGSIEGVNSFVADARFKAEKFSSKIRWFVIVKEGPYHCLCVPVQIYGGKGVARRGLIKSEHAIVYTSKPGPPLPAERPSKHEEGMKASIRILRNPGESDMDSMSRINFGKIYTVEKHVKVYDYGTVHSGYQDLMISHFVAVIGSGLQAEPTSNSPYSLGPRESTSIVPRKPTVMQPTLRTRYEGESTDTTDLLKSLKSSIISSVMRTLPQTSQTQGEQTIVHPHISSRSPVQSISPGLVDPVPDPEIEDAMTTSPAERGDNDETLKRVHAPTEPHMFDLRTGIAGSCYSCPESASAIEEMDDTDSASSVGLSDDVYADEFEIDERLARPDVWDSKLHMLEKNIVAASDLSDHMSRSKELMSGLGDWQAFNAFQTTPSYILQKVAKNFMEMKWHKYCGNSINLLVRDTGRPAVARLVNVTSAQIESLTTTKVVADCVNFLSILGLPKLADRCPRDQVRRAIPHIVASILDLGIVSYSGAHLEPFDKRYLSAEVSCLNICPNLVMRRCSMQCFDGYLRGCQVWIFEFVESIYNPIDNIPLYLSASAEDIADVWGPMRKAVTDDVPQEVRYFDLTNGYIVRWDGCEHEPAPSHDEISCHWVPTLDDLRDSHKAFPLDSDYKLLIGGILTVNKICETTGESFTKRMRHEGNLRLIGTREGYKRLDSHSISAGVSMMGVKIDGGAVYKMRNAQYVKDVLVQNWEDKSETRNPETLENYYGVIVSTCSSNAKRVPLVVVLGTSTMQTYLDSILYWTAEELGAGGLRDRYFQAFHDRNPGAFTKLFRSSDQPIRYRLGQAVSKCLRVLAETGTDEDHCLSAMWAPETSTQWLVSFHQWGQAWTGLLADSPTSCTFAVVKDICLEYDHRHWISRCQNRPVNGALRDKKPVVGTNVFETRLVINEAIPHTILPQGLKKIYTMPHSADTTHGLDSRGRLHGQQETSEYRWSVRNIMIGENFDLGKLGSLEVTSRLKGALLTRFRSTSFPIKEELKEMTRKQGFRMTGQRKHHWEYVLKVDRSGTQPLPICVIPT